MSDKKASFAPWPNSINFEDQSALMKTMNSAMEQRQLQARLEAEAEYIGTLIPRISKAPIARPFEEPGTVLTPVKKPCKFLGMSTRHSPTTGLPAGVEQTCCHPVHEELELLQQNVREILGYIHKFVSEWDIHNSAIAAAMTSIVLQADASALGLPNPRDYEPKKHVQNIQELRQYYQELSERLHQSEHTTKDVSDTKEFTD